MGVSWSAKEARWTSGERISRNRDQTASVTDDRGTYCLLVVATLLDILTPELVYNVDKFIAACQTYEGGFACSSFPFAPTDSTSGDDFFRAAQAEAHGGYTSCAINSYFLLSSMDPKSSSSPSSSSPASVSPSLVAGFPARIDTDGALRWSALQQGEAIEAGGFRGRNNKLVDGCYSWWVGGGFPVLEALATRERAGKRSASGVSKIEVTNGGQDGRAAETENDVTGRFSFVVWPLVSSTCMS